MSEPFDPEKETHIMLSRKSLGLLIGREVDHHEWMLVSSLRNTGSIGVEKGTYDFPDNAHGEKPFAMCRIDRDELKAYMAASKKYLGNFEWAALVSAMNASWHHEQDTEKAYKEASGLGTGMPGSRFDHLFKEWLLSNDIKIKTPDDVIRDVLSEITIPPHHMGKW
jgi:hypothetical protein